MKSKLKSGPENKYFAKRTSCKRIRSGQEQCICPDYASLIAYADYVLPYIHDYVHVFVRNEELQTSGWAQHNDKGEKNITFLLMHNDMTVWIKKNNSQILWETCFPVLLGIL